MDRVVWKDGGQPLDPGRLRNEPRRDSAAPQPKPHYENQPSSISSDDYSQERNFSSESPNTSSGMASPPDSDRHVQFDGNRPANEPEDQASNERHSQRTAEYKGQLTSSLEIDDKILILVSTLCREPAQCAPGRSGDTTPAREDAEMAEVHGEKRMDEASLYANQEPTATKPTPPRSDGAIPKNVQEMFEKVARKHVLEAMHEDTATFNLYVKPRKAAPGHAHHELYVDMATRDLYLESRMDPVDVHERKRVNRATNNIYQEPKMERVDMLETQRVDRAAANIYEEPDMMARVDEQERMHLDSVTNDLYLELTRSPSPTIERSPQKRRDAIVPMGAREDFKMARENVYERKRVDNATPYVYDEPYAIRAIESSPPKRRDAIIPMGARDDFKMARENVHEKKRVNWATPNVYGEQNAIRAIERSPPKRRDAITPMGARDDFKMARENVHEKKRVNWATPNVYGEQNAIRTIERSPLKRRDAIIHEEIEMISRLDEDEEMRVDMAVRDLYEGTKRHHRVHSGRKYSLQEGPRGITSERRVSIPPAEEPLPEIDREELASHRSDDPRGLRRHLIQQPKEISTVYVGRRDGGDRIHSILSDTTYKKMFDHSPHSVFVQLDELLATSDGDAEWKETARWIKYEEDVEEGSARWGRPHVASLSFHSLLNLRRCLETGVVLLDLDEKDLPGVAYRVVESMVDDELIEEADKPVVMRSLLLRHRHVNDERFRFSIGGKKHSSYTSLQSIWLEEPGPGGPGQQKSRRGSIFPRRSLVQIDPPNLADPKRRRSSYAMPMDRIPSAELRKKSSVAGSEKIDYKEVEYLATHASQDDLKRGQNEAIMKRIPEGAEATTVLVGAVGFLEQPTIAFVRLAQGIQMPSITEVPIPVRFMFILLGPMTADLDYHEVGRSISTLMSNPAFHGIAYKAQDRRDLLSAINEFLDDSIVLPPGNWDRQALLPFDELRAKSEMIRKRKQNAIEKKRAAEQGGLISEEKKALLELEAGWEPPKEPRGPLERTGLPFGGVINDIKRRYPYYVSDFTDALNGQCAAAAIFMYFAAVSSAITFGGLLDTKTNHVIGITETLLFTSIGGIIFALLSGQPMMITGATGPLLLLDESLANFCTAYGFNFLAARMYCGLWMIVIALAVASVEGSVTVKKITRFTEDIFAFLISLIFIGEPVTSIINVYRHNPLGVEYAMFGCNGTSSMVGDVNVTVSCNPPLLPPYPAPQPNTALFCTILTLSTFIIAYYLRIFRNGKFLGRSARRALGDFGVPIAIVLMVGLSYLVPVFTENLKVPAGLEPTDTSRSWLVPLNPGLDTIPPWAIFAMVLPALMVYIIVFMETHIAELIVDKPERKLKKGSGFHMDIVIMSFVNCLCGLFGAPWQCVATVRSVSHVSALTVMSTTHAPGDKPHVVEVKEQRLTGLLVALLVGISVLASALLQLVPMAVLFGVFLYMGISALGGIQFWDRCILLLKPVKHHAQLPYVRRVPTSKMHLYTIIQIAGILLLYTVKSSRFSLALPFFLVMMVPLRMSLVYLFTPMQLRALDGAQKDIDKDDEPDFYEEAPLP